MNLPDQKQPNRKCRKHCWLISQTHLWLALASDKSSGFGRSPRYTEILIETVAVTSYYNNCFLVTVCVLSCTFLNMNLSAICRTTAVLRNPNQCELVILDSAGHQMSVYFPSRITRLSESWKPHYKLSCLSIGEMIEYKKVFEEPCCGLKIGLGDKCKNKLFSLLWWALINGNNSFNHYIILGKEKTLKLSDYTVF